MAYEVRLSSHANDELEDIVRYLAVSLDAPGAASAMLDELDRKLALLRTTPRMYPIDEDISELAGAEVRAFRIKRYVAWYTINENRFMVTIAAMLHGRQDAEKWLVHGWMGD